ncbi:hypothetical protein A9255_09745 [Xenorhabdus hominickii]|uniref:Transposase n=1 Tax=Xenorhabdus hominickii TaxID=351679 RepID=A0A2G0QAE5_XENHO|nr:hypothetical protein A9255_09745 [Xenorhabdus hominickii]PHM56192.1 transposase [Xenorhabdus hominickii]
MAEYSKLEPINVQGTQHITEFCLQGKVDVYYRYCHKSEEVKRHGKGNGGHPRYRCYAVTTLPLMKVTFSSFVKWMYCGLL